MMLSLSIKNLKLNKKRTIGTIIGIILCTALICATSGLFTSFRKSLIDRTVSENGYYHIALSKLDMSDVKNLELNKDISKINLINDLGRSYVSNEGDPIMNVYSASSETLSYLKYNIIKGVFPKNNNEILLSEKASQVLNASVGDKVTLEVGTRMRDGFVLNDYSPYFDNEEKLVNTTTKEYKVTGIVNRYYSSGKYAITTDTTSDNIKAFITLKNPRNYKKSISELLGIKSYDDLSFHSEKTLYYLDELNYSLLRWESFAFGDSTISMLVGIVIVIIIIIMISSIFCIRNSFSIATTEKKRLYGMLLSIGATKKQIRESVLIDALILSIIGIPLGIISGVLANYILVLITNYFFSSFNTKIIFDISIFGIIISIMLSFITVILSSLSSLYRASNVSPIENLRSNNDIKITKKSVNSPKIINKIFKTGGVLAYKNLKRSKKKYRTTVISLTISIFVFISLNAFIKESLFITYSFYTDLDYNVEAYSFNSIENFDSSSLDIREDVDKIYKLYRGDSITLDNFDNINVVEKGQIPKYCSKCSLEYSDYECEQMKEECKNFRNMQVVFLDDNTFIEYTKKLKINYNEAKDKGILADYYKTYDSDINKYKVIRNFKYKKGDIVKGYAGEDNKYIEIPIYYVTDIKPYGLENSYSIGGYLVLNKDYLGYNEIFLEGVMYKSSNPSKLVKTIENINSDISVSNYDEEAKSEKGIIIVISIFLYGFITVLTLIGLTSVFNTITSNMELRRKEFASLKSIGMTKKEFNRMIRLETLFYSIKSLIYGITLGIITSIIIHKIINNNIIIEYELPIKAIVISIIFVFTIIYIIMKYSMNKINEKNIIETIRNENI